MDHHPLATHTKATTAAATVQAHLDTDLAARRHRMRGVYQRSSPPQRTEPSLLGRDRTALGALDPHREAAAVVAAMWTAPVCTPHPSADDAGTLDEAPQQERVDRAVGRE